MGFCGDGLPHIFSVTGPVAVGVIFGISHPARINSPSSTQIGESHHSSSASCNMHGPVYAGSVSGGANANGAGRSGKIQLQCCEKVGGFLYASLPCHCPTRQIDRG